MKDSLHLDDGDNDLISYKMTKTKNRYELTFEAIIFTCRILWYIYIYNNGRANDQGLVLQNIR
jgi:hypothetical protein